MHAGLPAHDAVSALALHLEYGFLDAAERTVRLRYHLNTPTPPFGESGVHAEEVGGEDCGFVAAGATPDRGDGGFVVERVVWDEGGLDALEQRVDRRFQLRRFGFGFLRHLGVRRIDELAGFRELVLDLLEFVPHLDQRLEMPQLPAQRCHALLVPYGLRIGELSLYLRGTLDGVPEPVSETQLSELEPAVCLPYF